MLGGKRLKPNSFLPKQINVSIMGREKGKKSMKSNLKRTVGELMTSFRSGT